MYDLIIQYQRVKAMIQFVNRKDAVFPTKLKELIVLKCCRRENSVWYQFTIDNNVANTVGDSDKLINIVPVNSSKEEEKKGVPTAVDVKEIAWDVKGKKAHKHDKDFCLKEHTN